MEKEIYQTGKKRKNIRERGKKGRVEGWVLVEGYGGRGWREGGSGAQGAPSNSHGARQSAAFWGESQMFRRRPS